MKALICFWRAFKAAAVQSLKPQVTANFGWTMICIGLLVWAAKDGATVTAGDLVLLGLMLVVLAGLIAAAIALYRWASR